MLEIDRLVELVDYAKGELHVFQRNSQKTSLELIKELEKYIELLRSKERQGVEL